MAQNFRFLSTSVWSQRYILFGLHHPPSIRLKNDQPLFLNSITMCIPFDVRHLIHQVCFYTKTTPFYSALYNFYFVWQLLVVWYTRNLVGIPLLHSTRVFWKKETIKLMRIEPTSLDHRSLAKTTTQFFLLFFYFS